ncbi:MAG: hypothetical protein Q8K63_04725 [Acidimicrobiales bacterium]|nr:hypothetical protein [Acidimicrobiales bacterium]
MNITRNDDGTLVVPVAPVRQHKSDDGDTDAPPVAAGPTTRVLHPGEGGYDEALAEWDAQQNPDREPAVSTASGREEAMAVIHEVAESPNHDVAPALEHVNDVEASAEALRHVLVGGVHAVEDFAKEVAEAEGGDPLPAHEATKIIGEVLAAID